MEMKTPLYDCHEKAGGKIVPFAGYLLPVQYSDVIGEHMAVREKAGLFDVSHMGEVMITGPDALKNINAMFTNDFTSMKPGGVRYSPVCNDKGGVVDDVLVYKLGDEQYLVVVNASNRNKDVEFMRAHIAGDAHMEDASDSYAQIALQGPLSREILAKLVDEQQIPAKYYSFSNAVMVAGSYCIVSQTGYTGEHGYELYCAPEAAPALWNALLEAGGPFGLIPCGLGARDTLRLEAAMPLYGHEMDDDISPLETGLGFAVKMNKDDFVGKAALEARGEPKIKRVGLRITGRGIAREHNDVFIGERRIGHTTSGTHCPYLKGAYAMALVDADASATSTAVEAEVRGRRIAAEIVDLPFYKKK